MVNEFSIGRLPELHFGQRKIEKLPQLIAKFGNKCLIITGQSSIITTPVWLKLVAQLDVNNIEYCHEIVTTEPTVNIIDDIVNKLSRQKIDVVIAIGGGSVLDAGKAVSAMLLINNSVYQYLEGIKPGMVHSGTKVPFIACPTTAGTGSEATKNAVICRVGENGFKRSLRHDNFIPDIAVIDPLLSLTCPPAVTAASGLDAFTQLFESYVSTASNVFTDALAYEGMQRVVKYLNIAYTDGNNIEARANMAYAAYLSGICLANAGLGVVHGFASSVAAYFNVPHGVICGTLLGVANEMNISKLLDSCNDTKLLYKYAMVGRLFSADKGKSDYYYIMSLTDQLHKWIAGFDIPKLSKYGLTTSHVDKIVSETGLKNNPVFLEKDELVEILTRRI
jgi:alcohol dehydrogenase class IV